MRRPHTERPSLDEAIEQQEERGQALRQQLASRQADLPLRFWRQQAHFTTPAERDIALKALTGGTSSMVRILDRFEVTPELLAERMGADPAAVQPPCSRPPGWLRW